MTRIEQAQKFAHEAHDSINQKRKYSGKPYWVHTDEVAAIVASTAGTTEDMVVAAHLHDVLEDVWPKNALYSPTLITKEFGLEVYLLVAELTDEYIKEKYPHLNRAQRHALENERLGKTLPESKTIKLADLISNTRSIVAEDPDFARVYLREKLALLPFLTAGSPALLNQATQQALEGFKALGMELPVYTSGVK